jgi:dUTP pyrophosphatase
MKKKIEVRILNPLLGSEKFPLPSYATPGSAGLDLRACQSGPVVIPPGGRSLFPTGLAVNILDRGVVALVASRSGLSLNHGVRVAQGVGVIDSDYHGEIGVILANDGPDSYTVHPGDRIAQLLFMPVYQTDFLYVDSFGASTGRGEGGFGHTGRF